MKLIQLNAWYWRLYWPLRRFLESEGADIICAQESTDSEGLDGIGFYTAARLLQEGLADYFVESTPCSGAASNLQKSCNVAILAKSPLIKVAEPIIPHLQPDNNVLRVSETPDYHRLLHAKTEIDGRTVNLLTYHGRLVIDPRLQPHAGRMGTPATADDMQRIAAYLDTLSGPTILTGDFNLWPDAPVLEPINRRLRNLVTPAHMVGGRNELAWKADEIVSHCFVSDEIRVQSFRVARELVSDHQPLALEFDLSYMNE